MTDDASLGAEALRRGDGAAAARHFELALVAQPLEVAFHHQLALAHQHVLQRDGAEAILDLICTEVPGAFTSQLHRARLRELRGDVRGAVMGYLSAIKTAQFRGFWQDEGSTPEWLRKPVLHAMEVAHEGRVALAHEWIDPLAERFGNDEIERVAKCVAMHLGLIPPERPDPRQRPSFLYFPDLPVQPVFDRPAFADALEAQTAAIRAELAAVRDGEGVRPFHDHVPEAARDSLTRGGSWDAYFFFRNGTRFDPHHAACPMTSAALGALPLDVVPERGPEVCFSIMRPGAHILPHRGVTNTRAVFHLALDIPDGCALDLVGVEELHWTEGRCFVFDDTFEHQAWNRSDRVRGILLGDIWNPHLREAERLAIAELVPKLGDYGRATSST